MPRRQHGGLYYVLVLFLVCGAVQGSEDEVVRASLRQRTAAHQMQAVNPNDARWQWAYQHFGMPCPPTHGFYDAEVHRAEDPMPWLPPSVALKARYDRDAVLTLRMISNVWRDVTDVLQAGPAWQLHEGHGAIRRSLVLNEGARHFLVVTPAETQAHIHEVAVFMEIIWYSDGREDKSLTTPWIPPLVTTLQIFQFAGLLTTCTTSHRCDLFVDGSLVDGVAVTVDYGSFIQIEVYHWSPPQSEDEQEHPAAIANIQSPERSSTTVETSSDDDLSTSESSAQAGTDEYTRAVHLFRPPDHRGRPTQVHALIPPYSRTWRTSVFAAWPALRYTPWQHRDVHPSFDDDFPQQDDVDYKVVIVPEDLPSPDHAVALTVVAWQRLTFFRATTLPPWSTTGHVLAALELLPWCGPTQEHCMITHNGHQWSPVLRQHVNHGDYIRVNPRTLPFPGFADHLANVFNREDELHPWQHIDAIAAARLSGAGDQASSLLPGPFPTPRTSSTTDWYWITMAWIMSLGAFGILRGLCPKEPYLPMQSRSVQGRRYRQAHCRLVHHHGARAFAMAFLLLSQQVIESEAFQTRSWTGMVEEGLQQHAQKPNALSSDSDVGKSPLQERWSWNDFDQLPPPGNPTVDVEWPSFSSMLTEHGRVLCAYLDMNCGLALARNWHQTRCQSATGKVSEVWRPIPTPARALLKIHAGSEIGLSPRTPPGKDQADATEKETGVSEEQVFGDHQANGSIEDVCPLHCTDRDLDDLMEQWEETSPLPFEISGDVPALLQPIMARPCLEISKATQLVIYTDGSRGAEPSHEGQPSTTWTFVVLGLYEDLWHVVMWYGDFLELDPLATHWCGAINDTVLEGETCALLGAYLWILQAEFTEDIPVYSDSLLALNMSTGRYQYRFDDEMMVRTRAVYHFLQVCSHRTGRYRVAHVKAHQGHLGNELADYIAGAIRTEKIQRRPLPRHFATWFHGSPPKILQAGFTMDFIIRPLELPCLRLDTILFPPADTPHQAPEWLPQARTCATTDTTQSPSLTFVTYNVHTLKRKGASAFLRDQLESKKIFMAGLQETRISFESTFDSSYLRFCAPADKGQGGTELWIARGVPFALVAGERCCLRRQDVQVLHADPECLLAEIVMGTLSFLACVAHGPHKGYPAAQIREWWTGFTAGSRHVAKIVT